MRHDKFHGRIPGSNRPCDVPGCREHGEFRAPGRNPPSANGPGDYRWFCLDHVRQFNAGYDWFEGMTAEEILRAQSPLAGWESEVRAFRPDAGIDAAPRWADFADPLDAISGRARMRRENYTKVQQAAKRGISPEDRRAFDVLGLDFDADRRDLRGRYSELVRRYHPDRNGGDRSHEGRLQEVVEAYQQLKGSRLFA